jgi:hypothetical protein
MVMWFIYDHLVYLVYLYVRVVNFVGIWYTFYCILYQERSGNPGSYFGGLDCVQFKNDAFGQRWRIIVACKVLLFGHFFFFMDLLKG